MTTNEFNQLVLSRYACRNFDGRKIDLSILKKICELSKNSPSACNSQPWKMVVINHENIDKITECLTTENRNLFLKNVGGYICLAEHNQPTLKNDVSKFFGDNHFVKYDIGEITAYITLFAKTFGIDSCVIGWMDKNKIGEVLELERDYECNIVIALGYCSDEPRQKIRKENSEIIKTL